MKSTLETDLHKGYKVSSCATTLKNVCLLNGVWERSPQAEKKPVLVCFHGFCKI